MNATIDVLRAADTASTVASVPSGSINLFFSDHPPVSRFLVGGFMVLQSAWANTLSRKNFNCFSSFSALGLTIKQYLQPTALPLSYREIEVKFKKRDL